MIPMLDYTHGIRSKIDKQIVRNNLNNLIMKDHNTKVQIKEMVTEIKHNRKMRSMAEKELISLKKVNF
jgi:hypothetical protein